MSPARSRSRLNTGRKASTHTQISSAAKVQGSVVIAGAAADRDRQRQEELDLAHQVAGDDRGRRERAAAPVDDAQAGHALARRAAVPGELEAREVEGAQAEQRQHAGRAAEMAAGEEASGGPARSAPRTGSPGRGSGRPDGRWRRPGAHGPPRLRASPPRGRACRPGLAAGSADVAHRRPCHRKYASSDAEDAPAHQVTQRRVEDELAAQPLEQAGDQEHQHRAHHHHRRVAALAREPHQARLAPGKQHRAAELQPAGGAQDQRRELGRSVDRQPAAERQQQAVGLEQRQEGAEHQAIVEGQDHGRHAEREAQGEAHHADLGIVREQPGGKEAELIDLLVVASQALAQLLGGGVEVPAALHARRDEQIVEAGIAHRQQPGRENAGQQHDGGKGDLPPGAAHRRGQTPGKEGGEQAPGCSRTP